MCSYFIVITEYDDYMQLSEPVVIEYNSSKFAGIVSLHKHYGMIAVVKSVPNRTNMLYNVLDVIMYKNDENNIYLIESYIDKYGLDTIYEEYSELLINNILNKTVKL